MHKILQVVLLSAGLSINCAGAQAPGGIDMSRPHLRITITFNPESYKSMMLKKLYPTYVLWVEEAESGMVKTVYVTAKAGKGKWFMADARPSSVPVWYGVRKKESLKGPAVIDAVTSATPSGTMITHLWQVPDSMLGGKLTVYLEGNVSFDYNEFYRKDLPPENPLYSEVNGQPSLVWKAVVRAGVKPANDVFGLIGHGHVTGKNNDVDKDLSKITTAKRIFKDLQVSFAPGNGR